MNPRRTILTVLPGLGVVLGMATPVDAQPLTRRAQASASGGHAVTPVARRRANLRPGRIQFRVTAQRPQRVDVKWNVLCYSATEPRVDREGVRTLRAPGRFTPQLPPRTYRSDDCYLSAFASFVSSSIGGRLTVSIWATTAPETRLLAHFPDAFRARPDRVEIGTVLVTGPLVTERDIRAGRYGRLRWTRWKRSEARGRGRIWLPFRPPNGSGLPVRPHLINFRAYRVREGRYTRLWYAYTASGRRHETWNNLVRSNGRWTWRVTRGSRLPQNFL